MASRRLTLRASSSLLTLLATGVLLTACMDDATNGPATGASPSSVGNPSSENNSAVNYLYASTNVMDGSGNFTGQQINLVDPSTGTLLKSVAVDTSSTQLAAQAFTVSSDGLSTQAGNDVVLYYTSGGKVYALGLSKPASPGNGQQVSSETQACGLIKVIPKDASATQSWLLIGTAGADGQCDTVSDNEVKLASSDANGSTAATVVGNSSQEIRLIDTQRDGTGKLVNVIASVRVSALDSNGNSHTVSTKLVAISASTGAPTDVVNGSIASVQDSNDTTKSVIPTVSFFGRVAGSSNQIYVRVGQDVRVLSWASGAPTLQTSVVTTLANTDVPFVHTDGQATYVVDGSSVKVLKANAAASVLTSALPATAIVQTGSAMSASSLVLITRDNSDKFGLYVVDKSTGAITSVTWASDTLPKIEATNGDVVVLSAASAAASDVKLMRFNAATPGTAPIGISADHAHVITTVHSATTTLSGETAGTHVVWCDAAAACNASKVNSYQVVANANLPLSTASSTSPTWQLTNTLSRSTTSGLLGSSSQTGSTDAPIWSSDSLWLFDAAKASSLSQVSLSSGS